MTTAVLDPDEITARLRALPAQRPWRTGLAVLVAALLITAAGGAVRSRTHTVRSELDTARVAPSPAPAPAPVTIPHRDLLVRTLAHLGTTSAVITGVPERVTVAILPGFVPDTLPLLTALLSEFGFPPGTDARLTRSTALDGAQLAWNRDGDLLVVWTNHQDFGLRLVIEPSRPG